MLDSYARLLRALETRRQAFLAELESLTEAELTWRPSPDAWPVMQVAQHLELVERGMLRMMTDPGRAQQELRRRPKNIIGSLAVWVVMTTGIRVKLPSRVAATASPAGDVDLPTLRTRWSDTDTELRRHFASCTEADAGRYVALHPVAGPLTGEQTLRFLVRHFDHHLKQVRRIRKAYRRAS
jgi:hypothetical protein